MSLILALSAAWSAEVVWLAGEPTAEDTARIAVLADAKRAPIDAATFRFAATDRGRADDDAWAALDNALRDVRPYETRLDGELVIQRDLARPIANIRLITNDAERDKLFAALAYQGFAIDRYFGDTLGHDERAVDLRVALPDGSFIPRPWLDAIALAPDRAPTPYEIAEAPQRARYNDMRVRAQALLPALVAIEGLPAGATLFIDGRPIALDAARQVRLPPGRHLVHVARDGHITSRADIHLQPASSLTLNTAIDDAAWAAWVADIADDGAAPLPSSLSESLSSLGGEVWLAWMAPAAGGPRASRLTKDGAVAVDTTPPAPQIGDAKNAPDPSQGLLLGVGLGAGWLSSGDFLLQEPTAPATRATVNSASLNAVVDLSYGKGLFRASLIGDIAFTPGEHHVALTGEDGALRVRPDVSVGLGVKYAQVTGGFLFPYHPSVGARATVPLWRGLELLATGRVGLPISAERDDGSTWTGLPVYTAWVGLGWRQRVGP